uniref:C2H2-type domain-containing protein n=1 Tax=Rhodosorus marinus TaxID=101924 RepID=A0A7S0BSN6_9RHOD
MENQCVPVQGDLDPPVNNILGEDIPHEPGGVEGELRRPDSTLPENRIDEQGGDGDELRDPEIPLPGNGIGRQGTGVAGTDRGYVCSRTKNGKKCGKVFKKLCWYERHRRKDCFFVCERCTYTDRKRYNVLDHMKRRVCQKAPIAKCCRLCNRSFIRKETCIEHEKECIKKNLAGDAACQDARVLSQTAREDDAIEGVSNLSNATGEGRGNSSWYYRMVKRCCAGTDP